MMIFMMTFLAGQKSRATASRCTLNDCRTATRFLKDGGSPPLRYQGMRQAGDRRLRRLRSLRELRRPKGPRSLR
jgi:hypothetical protein